MSRDPEEDSPSALYIPGAAPAALPAPAPTPTSTPAPAPAEPPKPKTYAFGEYTITGKLGEGGMCHVFRARREGEAEDCALKLLKEDQRRDERVLDLFVTEADLSLLLKHENLVTTFDAGEIQGRYYIAMELIEGGNLREILAQCERIGVPLPPDFALYIVSEVLEGLDAVHNAAGSSGRPLGLVHRDVTPHNIFVCFDGRVVLGDFGIAQIKAYGVTDPTTSAVGKLGYLSPEACIGEDVDRRADLFACGILVHELLTGARLYSNGSEQEVMQAIVEARAVRPRKLKPWIGKELDAVVMKALARRPKDRFQSADEMVAALEHHWSRLIGDQRSIAAFMGGLFREEAREWRERRGIARKSLVPGAPSVPPRAT